MKFKVGDKVKIVANTSTHHLKIGETVKIVDRTIIENEIYYRVKDLNKMNLWYVKEADIEEIKEDLAI